MTEKLILKLLLFLSALFFCGGAAKAASFGVEEDTVGRTKGIVVIGKIDPGDELKFKGTALSVIRSGNYVAYVKLFSPGGDVQTALDIGRQIRILRSETFSPASGEDVGIPGMRRCMMTGQGQAHSSGYTDTGSMIYNTMTRSGDPRCDCASACFLIWAAGFGRNGDVLGVHRIKYDADAFGKLDVDAAEAQYGLAMRVVKDYLTEMDIPDNISRLLFAHSSAKMRYLTKAELEGITGPTPALEELILARCGKAVELPGGNAVDPDPAQSAAAEEHNNCELKTIEESAKKGAATYLKKVGGN